MIWPTLVAAALGCYLFKLVGLSVPEALLNDRRVRAIAVGLPLSLLAALIAIQTFSSGSHLTLDPRAAGLAAAISAATLRTPFVVVVAVATGTTALIRLIA